MENKIKSFVKKLSGAIKSQEQSHKDPVCGMDVKIDLNKSEYQGKTYYFCSSHCKKQFDSNPANFVN
ncbi:MAG: YHS domain-containing protein [Parcubacteria group bacterium GW2011_GWA2_39_18]|nr:MAG: YHS domain-containing protein [Parcubacteria group bacterium GW2011_GWA2_39_18]